MPGQIADDAGMRRPGRYVAKVSVKRSSATAEPSMLRIAELADEYKRKFSTEKGLHAGSNPARERPGVMMLL